MHGTGYMLVHLEGDLGLSCSVAIACFLSGPSAHIKVAILVIVNKRQI